MHPPSSVNDQTRSHGKDFSVSVGSGEDGVAEASVVRARSILRELFLSGSSLKRVARKRAEELDQRSRFRRSIERLRFFQKAWVLVGVILTAVASGLFM